jgi:hypothetical protein
LTNETLGSKRDKEEAARDASEEKLEEKIDRNLRDSFPASDPPEWVLGVDRREPN